MVLFACIGTSFGFLTILIPNVTGYFLPKEITASYIEYASNIPFILRFAVILNLFTAYGVLFKYFPHKHWSSKIIWSLLLTYSILYLVGYLGNYFSKYAFFLLIIPPFVFSWFAFIKKDKTTIPTLLKKKHKKAKLGFTLQAKKQKIYIDNPFRGILVSGGAGSGKSASYFEPIISQLAKLDYTGILYDFKSPELTNKIIQTYHNSDSSIKTYNVTFKNPEISHRLNPLHPNYLTSIAHVSEYSKTFINNLLPHSIKKPDFWTSNAQAVLEGIIIYLRNNHPDYCSLPHIIGILIQHDIEALIEKMSIDIEASGKLTALKQAIESKASKMVAGVMSTLLTPLSSLNSQEVFWILSGNDLSLDLNNPDDPKFLCLGNDATLSDTYAPIISLITSVTTRLMNQPYKQQSVVLIDEAPTIYIPNLDQIPATARSNKIATILGIQDFSQIVDRYGKEKAEVLLSNLGNQFYGRTTNIKSAEMVGKLFSKTDKTYWSKSKGSGTAGQLIHMNSNTNTGKSQSIQERDRVKTTDITNLKAGEFYGIIAEGNVNELLKVQMNRVEIEETNSNNVSLVSKEQMHQNYLKIIKEAKELFDTTQISSSTSNTNSNNDYQISI